MNHTTPARAAAFRDAYGVTEAQAEILAAAMSARSLGAPLGCEPVTRKHLAYLGFGINQLTHLADLERLGYLECVGLTDEPRPEKWLLATDRCFRAFELTPPPRVIGKFDAAAHASAKQEREERRHQERSLERNQRMKESA